MNKLKTKRNWSGNDRHWGPFTFSRSSHGWGFGLDSGEAEYPGCHLRVHAFRCTLLVELPQVIQPWRDEARVFGITVLEGLLTLRFGRQTMDSETEQRWSCFLPWTQWRFIRCSFYDREGKHFWTEFKEDRHSWKARREARESCPSVIFGFIDYDGECITATTQIEEREWRFGESCFKWISVFRRPKILRSLEIKFSEETGREKGSWKGGTLGHGIEMLPGELHEDAFKRYCAEHEMTFMGEVDDAAIGSVG